jgi:serine/threonine protein kinase
MLAPGQHVDRYELVCPVGEGGMAQVWVARQRGKHGFSKLFALKAIHHRFADDPAFRAMFLDEARIASAIEHPNVAQVFDLGEKDNLLYLVMEYVDGDSLSAMISAIARRNGERTATVPPAIALRIVADVLAGLHAAHRLKNEHGELRGVVHRDVSPSNILVGVRGDVKVIDFGIAHAADRAAGDTGVGSLKGKINYMAPEQALKEPLGAFTDVFGAGATLYKLLAGRSAYDGGSEANTLALLMSKVAPAPLGEPVSPLVAAIVARALSPDPGDRYASAREMQNAIEAAIAEEGYVADVSSWVRDNLSDRARARREQLTQKKKSEPPPAPDLPFAETMELAKKDVPEDPTKTPGFMDVRAIVARGPAPIAEPPTDDEEAPPPRAAPAAARVATAPMAARPEPTKKKDPPKVVRKEVTPAVVGYGDVGRRRIPRIVLIVAAVVGVLTLAVVLVAPGMVKSRAIAKAREVGVELDIGSAAVSLAGVTLRDVKARIPRIPEIEALTIARIEVVGFSGREVRVTSLDATIDGGLDDVAKKALALVQENRPRIAGTPQEPRRYVLVSSRFTWSKAFGEGTRIDAGDVGVDVDTKGAGVEDVKASIARFDIKGSERTFGPWGFAYDRTRDVARARLLLDPPLMDGPHVLVVWNRVGSTLFTLSVPRSPFTHLGIRPAELGLPADVGTELEAKVEGEETAQGKITGSGRIDLWRARVKGFSGPVDVRIEGAAKGSAGRPLDLERTSVTVGPFIAWFTGTLLPRSDGFRVDAMWKTQPIACEKLAKAEANKMGSIIEAIQDLAQRTGAARVTGTANASGLFRYDTKTPDDVGVTWTTKDTCGVTIFGF